MKLRDLYYLKVDNKITKQLKKLGMKIDQPVVALVRAIYFTHPFTTEKITKNLVMTFGYIREKAEILEKNNNKKAWLYKKALEQLPEINAERLKILLKEKKYDQSKDPNFMKSEVQRSLHLD